MKRTLKATTALLASVNLAVPLPALAQAEAEGRAALDRAVEACALDPSSDDCQAATDAAANQGVAPEDIEAEVGAGAEAEATAPEAPEAAPEAEAAPNAEPAGNAEAEAVTSDPSEDMTETAAPEASAEAESTAAPTDLPTTETAEQPTEGDQEATAETQAAPETSEAEAVADDELPSESELQEGLSEAEESAEEAPAESATAEADAQTASETEAQTEVTSEPATDPSESETEEGVPSEDELREGLSAAETDPPADAEAEADAQDAEIEAETEADTSTEDETVEGDAETTSTTEAETADEDSATSIEEETTADTSTAADADAEAEGETGATAPTDAEAEALSGAAPVAAAAAEDAEVVESTSDTVTEETARSSDEDFESAISRDATEQQTRSEANDDDDDDSGLSNLEKALLVGAGALAVGALLNNRRVVAASDDRVVVSGQDGGYELIKDDNALLRQPGAEVQTETFNDGSTRTTISYDDGSQVVTIRDADLRVVRRVRVTPDGQRVTLIDDLNQNIQPVDVGQLRQPKRPSRTVNLNNEAALREALAVDRNFDRAYSLSQVRNISEVRELVPAVDLEAITFDTGSAAIRPEQAEALRALGSYIRQTIEDDPRALFLVEGHTDAVGDAAYNLALSDRRAESVALALGEYFDVPTSNLVVQGYGERFLKRQTQDAERANRRASVRNITPLLQVAAAN